MRIELLKENLLEYIHHLSLYDYMAYGWVLLFFVIFLILSILISSKKPLLSVVFILLNFTFLLFSPLMINTFMNKTVRKNSVKIIKIDYLHFSKALIVSAKIKNEGKVDFKECKVKAKIIKQSKNAFKNFLYGLKPLKKRTIFIKDKITKQSSMEFKVVFDNFDYKKDYNVTIKAECNQ